jgi:hypothetical protein
MKFIFSLLVLVSFSAKASPVLNMKERLRFHMWVYGIEVKPLTKDKMPEAKTLPEEIERALRKI